MSGPGKAGEALALRLAVKVGHPLAGQLAGPVGHQHHGLLSPGSAGTVTCPTLGSGLHADITQKGEHLVEDSRGRCRPGWYGSCGQEALDPLHH
jgi:hypothetical protein